MSFIPIADYTFQKVHQISQIEFSPYSFREIYEMNKNPGMILGIHYFGPSDTYGMSQYVQYARYELSFVFLIPLCVPFLSDGIE